MGIDYSAGHAMVLSCVDMLNLINGKNKKAILEVIQSFHDEVLADKYSSDRAKKSVEVLSNISQKIKLADLKELILEYHDVIGEAGKYGGDCQFSNGLDGYDLMMLWEPIIDVCDINLPSLTGIQVFDSYRQHMDCPIGEPCFLFDVDDCYEKKLNSAGKNLKKFSGGYLNEVTWTDVSC
tara:strand:- start:828 stop:1367 length:540 start_codon:yes stop_codon:yes gene_type:complete